MVSRRVLLAALAAFVASAASASGPVAVVSGRFAPAPIDPNCDHAYLVCYYNCAPSNWYDQSCEDKCRPLRDACKPHLASATVGMNGKCLYECTQERAKCTGTPDQCDSQLQVCEGTCGLRAPSPSSNKCADTCQIKYSQCLSTPYCSQDFYCPSECAADYNSCAQACPSSSSSPVASSHQPVGMDPCERVCDAMNWKGLLAPGQYDRCLAECARQAAPTESTRTVRDWPTLKMAVATPVREGPTPSCVASCRDAQGTCNNAMPGNEYSCAAQYQQCLSQCPWNNVEVEVEEASKPQPHKPTVSECIASCPTKALEKCAKEPIARRAMCRARVPLTLIKCQAACAHPNGFEIEAPKPKPSSPLLGDCQPCDAIYDQCLPACNGMSNCQLKCMQNHFDCRMATPGC